MRVSVWELAPRCRFVGSYALRAGRGANTLHVPRRIGRHRLRAGAYHFVGVAAGSKLLDVRFRLLRKKRLFRVQRRNLADVCAPTTLFGSTAFGAGGPFASGGRTPAPPASQPATAPPTRHFVPPFLPPVLHALIDSSASPLVQAIFFALLGFAVVLLAAGSFLGGTAATLAGGAFVARHRATITLGGFALLVAAAFVMLHQ